MNRKQRAVFIANRLQEMYPNPRVPLNHKNSFTLLIAVLLSAQCTDERVNIVTKELFKVASSPEQMLSLGHDKIYNYIKSCGLAPKKTKAIVETSKILIDQHNSKVPKDIKALEDLPGVGHKTASVVLNQAFGIETFPVDTHIHRLAQRWDLTNGKSVVQTEKDLKIFLTNHFGVNCTYKLFCMEDNFVLPGDVMERYVSCAPNYFQKERRRL